MDDIKSYAAMAKFTLDEPTQATLSAQADRLIDSFKGLEKANTDGIEPMVTVLDIVNVLREDAADKKWTREELLSTAPAAHEGYFQVPKTLE